MTVAEENAAVGPLSRLKVVEFGDFVAAPYCGKLIADLGADVVKIERPGVGDPARAHGPFPDDLPDAEKSGLFLYLNTNKRSVTLDVSTPTGTAIFKRLIAGADLLIEAQSKAESERLGLGAAQLAVQAPSLVSVSISAFGRVGPSSEHRGSGLIAAHAGGAAYMNPAEGVQNLIEPPLAPPGHFADFTSGLTAALGALGAVIAACRFGGGQHVDISEQEALASIVRTELAAYAVEEALPGRMAVRKRSGGMLYRCQEGYVVMSGTGDGFWPSLVKMMGAPAWTSEEWCATNIARNKNVERVNAAIETWTGALTAEAVEVAAIAARVPCACVRTVAALGEDDQLRRREFFVQTDHVRVGTLPMVGAPYKLSKTPWRLRRPAPLLGQHNEEIFCGRLGYSRADLVRLRQMAVI